MSVCTLEGQELEDRVQTLRREIAPRVIRSERVPGGLALDFDASADMRARLEDFVSFERVCCASLRFDLRERDAATLRVTIEGEGAAAFERLSSPPPLASETRRTSGLLRLTQASAFGLGGSFLVCCALPLGLAAIGIAALSSQLAVLDQPWIIGAGSLALAIPAWLHLRRRDRPAPAGDGDGDPGCGC